MDEQARNLYLFEDFTLDISRKCLWHTGSLVSLTPKALETLLVLIKYRERVVDKDTLLSEVWADTFVEEATLAQNISTLRRVLGTRPDKKFIETIPRRGYRFVMEVREIVSAPAQTEKFYSSDPLDIKAIKQIDVTEINDTICLVDISMRVQALISNNGKYLISVTQCGGDWILQMRPVKNFNPE